MKRSKGFTLVEVLVVLAIIAILIAIALPVYFHMTESANKTICASHIRNADTLYAIKRVVTDGDDQAQKDMMGEVLTQAYQAVPSGEGYTGVCPSGGVYTVEVENGTAKVSCSKHGDQAADPGNSFTPYDYIQMFLRLDNIELKDAGGNVVSNGTILDYLEYKAQGQPNGFSLSLDSEANHLGDKGISRQIETVLKKAYPKVAFDQNSWRIYYKKGNPGEYTVTWSNLDIADKAVGDKLDVVRYDVNKGEYTAATTAKVGQKTEEGKTVKYIDLSGVTDWTVTDPGSAFS